MDKVSILEELADDYRTEFGRGDQRDSVEEGVERLIEKLSKEDPNADGSGYRLILRNDLCSFPELDYMGDRLVGKDNHLIVDPNPIFSRIRKRRESEGGDSLPCEKHYEMNRVIEFLSNIIPEAPFFRRVQDTDSYIAGSSRAFFLDHPGYSPFNMSDHTDFIEREIESLSDSRFITTAFHNPLYRYNVELDEDVTKDIVRETLLTYFSRLELNSMIDGVVSEYTPMMLEKLYGKTTDKSADVEKIVSQLFVAHDWLSSRRESWLGHPERYATIYGENINTSDYLEGGGQMLLMEIVPKSIKGGNDLKAYSKGQEIRMIHEEEFQKEGNYVQATDLGDQIKHMMENRNMEELKDIASRARCCLDDYLNKLPVISVRYNTTQGDTLFG